MELGFEKAEGDLTIHLNEIKSLAEPVNCLKWSQM